MPPDLNTAKRKALAPAAVISAQTPLIILAVQNVKCLSVQNEK